MSMAYDVIAASGRAAAFGESITFANGSDTVDREIVLDGLATHVGLSMEDVSGALAFVTFTIVAKMHKDDPGSDYIVANTIEDVITSVNNYNAAVQQKLGWVSAAPPADLGAGETFAMVVKVDGLYSITVRMVPNAAGVGYLRGTVTRR